MAVINGSEEDPPFPDCRITRPGPRHVNPPDSVGPLCACEAVPGAGTSWGGGGLALLLACSCPQHLEKWAACTFHGKSQTELSLLICAPKGRIWRGSGRISEIKSLLRKQGFQQSWEIQR